MSIAVGAQSFPSKKALMDHVRGIVARYEVGDQVGAEDFGFLSDLFRRHHSYEVKAGPGIRAVRISQHPEWPRNKALAMIRVDGREVDISWHECINPTPRSKRFVEACRTAVVDQIVEFKKRAFAGQQYVPCAITGEPLRFNQCHVDHADPTFAEIVEEFVTALAIDTHKVKLTGHESGSVRLRFDSDIVRLAFADHHRRRARLRITSPKANLTRKRKAS